MCFGYLGTIDICHAVVMMMDLHDPGTQPRPPDDLGRFVVAQRCLLVLGEVVVRLYALVDFRAGLGSGSSVPSNHCLSTTAAVCNWK